jgi:hypothetical protein
MLQVRSLKRTASRAYVAAFTRLCAQAPDAAVDAIIALLRSGTLCPPQRDLVIRAGRDALGGGAVDVVRCVLRLPLGLCVPWECRCELTYASRVCEGTADAWPESVPAVLQVIFLLSA